MGVGEDRFVVRLCRKEEAEGEASGAKAHDELETLAAVRGAH